MGTCGIQPMQRAQRRQGKGGPGNKGWDKEEQTARLQTHSSGCSPAWSLLPSRTKWWWDGGGGFATSWTPWWKQSRVLPMAPPWVCAQGLPSSGRNLCSPGCVSLLRALKLMRKQRGGGRCHGVMPSSDPVLPSMLLLALRGHVGHLPHRQHTPSRARSRGRDLLGHSPSPICQEPSGSCWELCALQTNSNKSQQRGLAAEPRGDRTGTV